MHSRGTKRFSRSSRPMSSQAAATPPRDAGQSPRGTPVSSLAPLYGENPCGAPSSDADVALIQCCLAQSHTDGGCGTDCAALAPYGSAAVTGEEYSGGDCSDYHVGWSCEVWYRNGKVVVA